jgi:hypothetical protein
MLWARQGVRTATIQEKTFSEDIVLDVVNQNRAVLGGRPIPALLSKDLKIGLTQPIAVSGEKGINVKLLERDIQNLRNVTLEQNQAGIAKSDEQLRDLIATIRSDPQTLRALSHLQLTELGMTLIDETGSCPLCDKPWPPGKLREYLEQRVSTAKVAAQHQKRITALSDAIANSVNTTIASVQKVIVAAQVVDLKDDLPLLQSWLGNLQGLLSALSAAVDKYPDPRFGLNHVKRMLASAEVVQTFTRVQTAVTAKYPEATPE